MKNTIFFFVTILLLQSSTLVLGQNKSSFKNELGVHQIDQLSAEMMSLFKLLMEEELNLEKGDQGIPFIKALNESNFELLEIEITVEIEITDNFHPAFRGMSFSNPVPSSDLFFTQSNRYLDLLASIMSANRLDCVIQNSFADSHLVKNHIREASWPIVRLSNTLAWFELPENNWDASFTKPIPATTSSLGGWEFKIGAGEGGYY